MSTRPRISLASLARKRAEKLTAAANLPTRQKRTFQVKRPVKQRLSRVLEKAGRVARTRKLQMLPRRERMFQVERRERNPLTVGNSRLKSARKVGSSRLRRQKHLVVRRPLGRLLGQTQFNHRRLLVSKTSKQTRKPEGPERWRRRRSPSR